MELKTYAPDTPGLTKYLFFTGKGGVGKTSTSCATAMALADAGKKVFLISTDPASNLQDVFETELDNKGKAIDHVPGLTVANLNPEEAASEYRESVVGPYRGKMPESVIQNMEEQLSGSCTVEIAAFNEFSHFITDETIQDAYDYIIFDTAPTGHTLRMLALPSAWNSFIDENTTGASCMGQLSGLGEQKAMYEKAVATLSDPKMTTLMLVARPEKAPLQEAMRASAELRDIGVTNQQLIINGLLDGEVLGDCISESFYCKQQKALASMPQGLREYPISMIPLRSYNISGIANIRRMLQPEPPITVLPKTKAVDYPGLSTLIQDLNQKGKKVIFTMGKGGVGKTTVASAIALGLAQMGKRVHLTTTDPAGHISTQSLKHPNITISNIDEAEELARYRDEVIGKARKNGLSQADIDYIEEDLRSPCTQEIAVFRAFADIVEKADDRVVVIDTAPTGHTLLLLNSTESYHKEMERSHAEIPDSVRHLLPRLKNPDETEVVIVTLPEATPYFEADRLQADLNRAGINNRFWVVNACLSATDTRDPFLLARAAAEEAWISRIAKESQGNAIVIPWQA
ncbi:arsenite efflux ATP-binding protein ArsA [Eubacterium aggregans]|uniref:Arsenite efflux ATP-binding protein ArsA n=1 Tax=Eubacterium aggregans TaxID=81409 RepID=A0A1H4CGV0_9FIRM|nr:arsenical pump-driving ATPase [Eubacterium aggregans]SEA59641.1 arsenite efflux ATP-binding protein ArsA [Eubacterium aggregans]